MYRLHVLRRTFSKGARALWTGMTIITSMWQASAYASGPTGLNTPISGAAEGYETVTLRRAQTSTTYRLTWYSNDYERKGGMIVSLRFADATGRAARIVSMRGCTTEVGASRMNKYEHDKYSDIVIYPTGRGARGSCIIETEREVRYMQVETNGSGFASGGGRLENSCGQVSAHYSVNDYGSANRNVYASEWAPFVKNNSSSCQGNKEVLTTVTYPKSLRIRGDVPGKYALLKTTGGTGVDVRALCTGDCGLIGVAAGILGERVRVSEGNPLYMQVHSTNLRGVGSALVTLNVQMP